MICWVFLIQPAPKHGDRGAFPLQAALMGRRVDASKLTPGIYVTSDGRKIYAR